MQVIIAGAGIGGLTTALVLHGYGIDVKVYESASEIRPLGVGINLLPHAVQALDQVGFYDRLLHLGVETRELSYFNRHGQEIWSEDRGKYAAYAWPQVSLHRGLLQIALLDYTLETIGKGTVTTNRRLVSYSQNDSSISARFADKSGEHHEIVGDVLIACDGIHSAARRIHYPNEGPPAYSGRMLWRGTTRDTPFRTGASMIMAGHANQKFVAYPISRPDAEGRSLINWIAELVWDKALDPEDWNQAGKLDDFLPQFIDWKFDWLDVPATINQADSVYEFPMVDRDPLAQWSFGRMTLLGDAAHPMYPIGSNGASQAIIDAQCLGQLLSDHDKPVEALKAYEQERLPATAKIVTANRHNGPEQCMQIAEERAPEGFNVIHDVIPRAELEEIAARYKQIAGFDKGR